MILQFVRRHVSQETLSEYLDNRLSPAQRRRVELHLSSCGKCREELESLRSTVDVLHSMPLVRHRRSFTLTETPAPLRAPARRAVPTWAVGLATSAAMAAFLVLLSTDLSGVLVSESPVRQMAQPEATQPVDASDASEDAAMGVAPPQAEASRPVEEEVQMSEEAIDTTQAAPVPTQGADAQRTPEGVAPPPSTQGSTPIYWRIAEGLAAALALVLAGGLLWRWRRTSGRAAG